MSKRVQNPSSFVMFEQNIASFIVDCDVRPCNPVLKLIR